ncbi:MAG: hypothetical protein ABI977_20650 [Acidobacteriota bacterium]
MDKVQPEFLFWIVTSSSLSLSFIPAVPCPLTYKTATARCRFLGNLLHINELYVAQMRMELQGWPGFNYQNWQTAAQFCADNKINLEEALIWADKAINEPFRGAAVGREDFSTLQTKAAVLKAMGRDAEAEVIMENALQLPGTRVLLIHFSPLVC